MQVTEYSRHTSHMLTDKSSGSQNCHQRWQKILGWNLNRHTSVHVASHPVSSPPREPLNFDGLFI
jgi:hypothetical protein